jgi:hypothetical protein
VRDIPFVSLGRVSLYARDERAAGVVVSSLPCPLLIATGTADAQWPRTRYAAMHLPAEFASIDRASHWGLVLSRRALDAAAPIVTGWLDERT